MKKLPWEKIGIGCLILTALVILRAAVSIGRARYWHQNWLAAVQKDPWIYVGFAALAVAIIAWTLIPSCPNDVQPQENEEEQQA